MLGISSGSELEESPTFCKFSLLHHISGRSLGDSLHGLGVEMVDESLDEGHLLPGVLHDNYGIRRATTEEVWSKDHREIGGVHLGDVDNLRPHEQLEELDQEGEDREVEVRQLPDEGRSQLWVVPHSYCLVV